MFSAWTLHNILPQDSGLAGAWQREISKWLPVGVLVPKLLLEKPAGTMYHGLWNSMMLCGSVGIKGVVRGCLYHKARLSPPPH